MMNKKDVSHLENRIPDLITKLGDGDELTRQHARLLLEHLDHLCIPALLNALKSANGNARRETIRVLGEIRNPQTAPALVDMLLDEDFSVRWAAMESLIRIGRDSLHPLLEKFTKNFDSPWLREGLHHILRVLKDRNELNNFEIALFDKLDKRAIPGFESGWNSEQAWAAEKALEILDHEE